MTRKLLLLNGLAVLAVVMYHSTGWGYTAMFWWTDRYLPVSVPDFSQIGSFSYYALRAIEQLIIFGIPSFLMVSGYFIASSTGRDQKTVQWRLILVRVRSLLIPYVLWSLIIIGLLILQGERYTITDVFLLLLTGRTASPFYYIPLLAQLFLLSPLLVPLARNHWKVLLPIALVIQVLALSLNYGFILEKDLSFLGPVHILNTSWLFTTQSFWFCLGMVVGFHRTSFKQFLDRFRWVFLTLAIVFFAIGLFEWEYLFQISGLEWIAPRETIVDQIYAFGFIMSFLAFDRVSLPASKQISVLGTKSFGVYLVHSPVLGYGSRIVYHILPGILAFQWLFVSLLIVLGLGIPIGLMALVNRSPFRRFYDNIFG